MNKKNPLVLYDKWNRLSIYSKKKQKSKDLAIFQGQRIRRTWHNNEWWFVIADVVKILTDSTNPRQYIKNMRNRDEELSKGWVQIERPLLIDTVGGKQKVSCANTEGIFRKITNLKQENQPKIDKNYLIDFKLQMKDFTLYLQQENDLFNSKKKNGFHNPNNADSISQVVMFKSVEDDGIFFNLEDEDETSNMNSFVSLQVPPEIFEVINETDIAVYDLTNLLPDSNGKDFILMSEFVKLFSQNKSNYKLESHFNPIKLSSSSKLIGFLFPDLSSLDVSSQDLITSLTTDSLTSLVSSSDISDISLIFFFNCSSFISSNVSTNACLATADQLMTSVSSISDFSSLGTDNVMVPILDLQSNYLYYVYTKDTVINLSEENVDFSLTPITEVNSNVNDSQEIYFLDADNFEIVGGDVDVGFGGRLGNEKGVCI